MAKINKTNAMRILDQASVAYNVKQYPTDGPLDAVSVAGYLHEPVEKVFKTLVTCAPNHHYYVFCVPAEDELDLKKCARAVGEKSIEMIHQKELLPLTGYIHGGCSPVGMKKQFPTVLQETAMLEDTIFVSGGKIGLQIEINPEDLKHLIHAEYADVVREK